MKNALIALCAFMLVTAGCSHKSKQPAPLQATATGTAIVESNGGKQIGYIGMPLDQPVVVQVNDASGTGVAGAAVYFSGPSGVSFTPAAALTDSSGQVTSTVALGQQDGRYKLMASTRDASGKTSLSRSTRLRWDTSKPLEPSSTRSTASVATTRSPRRSVCRTWTIWRSSLIPSLKATRSTKWATPTWSPSSATAVRR